MISNDIQELLKNITKSLIKIETKELDALISRQLTHIDNIDFHRYEISHRKIESLKFSFCSFRGAFISYSSFTNCNFINCSFITAIVCNTKFTNCTFINCVFRSMHTQDDLISNCSFQNCHIEDNIFSLTNAIMDKDIKKLIMSEAGKLIVIDNADILLNDDTRKYISMDDKNQYLIIGRNPKNLFATKENLFELVSKKVGEQTKFCIKQYL